MKAWTEGPDRFFRKHQAPDALAAMTADLATDDYRRLGRQLLVDGIPSLWAVANDPSRPFGRHGVGSVVLGEVTAGEAPSGGETTAGSPEATFADLIVVDQEAIRGARVIDGSSGTAPLGDDFRAEGGHIYGNEFPPADQLGNDL